jgi:membrane protein implicated in regulation of membrane protease activity
MGVPKMMIAMLGATALVVAVVVVLATGEWWALGVALAAHAIASTAVIGYTWRAAGKAGGKPDPLTEARIEQEDEERPPPARPQRTARDYEVFS